MKTSQVLYEPSGSRTSHKSKDLGVRRYWEMHGPARLPINVNLTESIRLHNFPLIITWIRQKKIQSVQLCINTIGDRSNKPELSTIDRLNQILLYGRKYTYLIHKHRSCRSWGSYVRLKGLCTLLIQHCWWVIVLRFCAVEFRCWATARRLEFVCDEDSHTRIGRHSSTDSRCPHSLVSLAHTKGERQARMSKIKDCEHCQIWRKLRQLDTGTFNALTRKLWTSGFVSPIGFCLMIPMCQKPLHFIAFPNIPIFKPVWCLLRLQSILGRVWSVKLHCAVGMNLHLR